MNRYGCIYMITNKESNMIYVGQTTKSVMSRLSDHIKEKRNRHISNAIRKYGLSNFEIVELMTCFDKKSLNDMEIYFVQKFNCLYPQGYNHRAGGNQNGICSQELKRKISQSKIGKPLLKRRGEIRTEEQRLKISRTLGGQEIVAINVSNGNIIIYPTARSTRKDGHSPSNVVQICKNAGRKISKGYTFMYMNDYANQSGSKENKESLHAQRLESETTEGRLKSLHESPIEYKNSKKIV